MHFLHKHEHTSHKIHVHVAAVSETKKEHNYYRSSYRVLFLPNIHKTYGLFFSHLPCTYPREASGGSLLIKQEGGVAGAGAWVDMYVEERCSDVM